MKFLLCEILLELRAELLCKPICADVLPAINRDTHLNFFFRLFNHVIRLNLASCFDAICSEVVRFDEKLEVRNTEDVLIDEECLESEVVGTKRALFVACKVVNEANFLDVGVVCVLLALLVDSFKLLLVEKVVSE